MPRKPKDEKPKAPKAKKPSAPKPEPPVVSLQQRRRASARGGRGR